MNISRASFYTLAISLFAVLLIAATGAPARADVLTSAQEQGVRDLLSSMEEDKALFGLGGVDFSETSVAGPIAVYRCTADGLAYVCDVYLLMEDGRIVSVLREGFANQFFSYAGEAQDLSATLEKYSLDDFAIIQDVDGIYLTDGSDAYYSYCPTIEKEEDLVSLSTSADLPSRLAACELNGIATADSLDYRTPMQRSFDYDSGYKYCLVPHVPQTMTYTCWAASAAMIINYHRGTNYSDSYLAYCYAMTDHQAIDAPRLPSDVQTILNDSIYGLGAMGLGSYSIYNACPTYSQVKTAIDGDRPFVAGLTGYYLSGETYNGGNHFVVVDGYNSTNQNICLWDPSYPYETPAVAQLYNGYYYYYPYYSSGYYWYVIVTVYR